MTEETIRELWREHDRCVLRARELGESEIQIRKEWRELRDQMEEALDALREKERAAYNAREEYSRRAGRIGSLLSMYDERFRD